MQYNTRQQQHLRLSLQEEGRDYSFETRKPQKSTVNQQTVETILAKRGKSTPKSTKHQIHTMFDQKQRTGNHGHKVTSVRTKNRMEVEVCYPVIIRKTNSYWKSTDQNAQLIDQTSLQIDTTCIDNNIQVNSPFKGFQQFLTPLNSRRKKVQAHKVIRGQTRDKSMKVSQNDTADRIQTDKKYQMNRIRMQNFLESNEKETVRANISKLIDWQQTEVRQLDRKQNNMRKAQTQEICDGDDKKQQYLNPEIKTFRKFAYYMDSLRSYLNGHNKTDPFSQIYVSHFIQQFNALQFCRQVQMADISNMKVVQMTPYTYSKTVVLDLDETLIHCNDALNSSCDFKIPVQLPMGHIIEAGINVRPFAQQFLQELSQYCEIVVFTASHSQYANKIIDKLDPHQKWISQRLFREHCVQTPQGVHIKDLRVINRDLESIVLVDNASYSYAFQIDNGIPIIPYYDNKNDQELVYLLEYLKQLMHEDDVRILNRKTFQLNVLVSCQSLEEALIRFSKP